MEMFFISSAKILKIFDICKFWEVEIVSFWQKTFILTKNGIPGQRNIGIPTNKGTNDLPPYIIIIIDYLEYFFNRESKPVER